MTCISSPNTKSFNRERSGAFPTRSPPLSKNSTPFHNSRPPPDWRATSKLAPRALSNSPNRGVPGTPLVLTSPFTLLSANSSSPRTLFPVHGSIPPESAAQRRFSHPGKEFYFSPPQRYPVRLRGSRPSRGQEHPQTSPVP